MALVPLTTSYAGRGGPLFRLALGAAVLTVLTLGLYRFWMKTRLRRYYWSAIRPGGTPMEYLGTPTEKLLGFLTAVVVLAFYIGIVNLALMFLSFSLFEGTAPAYAVSFLGIVPMIFYAQYRARRYLLARTRWRGIRFGLEPGVGGYVWRAALWWGLVIVSAGILWPAKTWALEKYRADRTFFGSARFEQGGSLWSLFGAMKHVYLAVALLGLGSVLGGMTEDPLWALIALMGALWLPLGLTHWQAMSWRRLTEQKRLGAVGFVCRPRPGRLFGIYLGGSLAMGGLFSVFVLVAGVVLFGLMAAFVPEALEGETDLESLAGLPAWVLSAAGVAIYFGMFLLWGVLKQVFITLPVLRHIAESTTITGAEALAGVRQRARDEMAEAEGFADALPLGGGL